MWTYPGVGGIWRVIYELRFYCISRKKSNEHIDGDRQNMTQFHVPVCMQCIPTISFRCVLYTAKCPYLSAASHLKPNVEKSKPKPIVKTQKPILSANAW